jgi:hypothetical protein
MPNYRKEAQGRKCQAKIYGVCNGDPATTILHHCRRKSLFKLGMGQKPNDKFGAWVCSACHEAIHKGKTELYRYEDMIIAEYEAILKTQWQLMKEGKI